MFGHCTGYTNWWYGPGAFFQGPTGMLVTLLFWGFITVLFVWLFQSIFKGKTFNSSSCTINNSLNILSERYARGEINKEEFDQMKTDLT